MSTRDIRSHLGTRSVTMISGRDMPDYTPARGTENELWLYEDGQQVRQLGTAEAWNIMHQGGKP